MIAISGNYVIVLETSDSARMTKVPLKDACLYYTHHLTWRGDRWPKLPV